MIDEKLFNELLEKIDILVKINLFNVIEGKNLTEQVDILSSIELNNKHIADILGTTPEAVRSLKSRIRKRKKREIKEEVT